MSTAESNTSLNTTVLEPLASKFNVTVPATVVITGAVTSLICTVMAVTRVLPYESNTNAVTVFEPKSSQSKYDWLMLPRDASRLQLSAVTVAKVWAIVLAIDTNPCAFKSRSRDGAVIVGFSLSITLTCAVAVLALPAASVNVIVTAVVPQFAVLFASA